MADTQMLCVSVPFIVLINISVEILKEKSHTLYLIFKLYDLANGL